MEEYDHLIANLKAGDSATADTARWEPVDLAGGGQGLRLHGSAARRAGALGPHQGRQDRELPDRGAFHLERVAARTARDSTGAYESALLGTPMADPKRPVEILRTIHSFDPCLACASHVIGPNGEKLAEVKVR